MASLPKWEHIGIAPTCIHTGVSSRDFNDKSSCLHSCWNKHIYFFCDSLIYDQICFLELVAMNFMFIEPTSNIWSCHCQCLSSAPSIPESTFLGSIWYAFSTCSNKIMGPVFGEVLAAESLPGTAFLAVKSLQGQLKNNCSERTHEEDIGEKVTLGSLAGEGGVRRVWSPTKSQMCHLQWQSVVLSCSRTQSWSCSHT